MRGRFTAIRLVAAFFATFADFFDVLPAIVFSYPPMAHLGG
jgi:hypothetical protein